MRKFCVCYSLTVSYDSTVSAKTKEEAVAKVREVIEDAVITGAWPIRKDEISLGGGYSARPLVEK